MLHSDYIYKTLSTRAKSLPKSLGCIDPPATPVTNKNPKYIILICIGNSDDIYLYPNCANQGSRDTYPKLAKSSIHFTESALEPFHWITRPTHINASYKFSSRLCGIIARAPSDLNAIVVTFHAKTLNACRA